MDVNAILNSVMGSAGAGIDKAVTTAQSSTMPSGLLGGAAAGGLAALVLSNKKARKMGTQALKYGGMAAIGGMAYKAWRDHKDGQAAPAGGAAAPSTATSAPPALPAPAGSIFDLAAAQQNQAGEDMRLVLVRAMISAAKADGHIDADEQARIEQQISAQGIGAEEQQFLVEQLNAPSDPIAIARLSEGDEQAAEIYLVSLLALDLDTPEERRYLDRLGDALLLPDALKQHLEQQAQAAQ
ncbi:MAG: tellurite resistance TerB family protein [Pseudomonadota bacterium]